MSVLWCFHSEVFNRKVQNGSEIVFPISREYDYYVIRMANNVKNPLVVTVPEAITKDGVTHYLISVQVRDGGLEE